MRKIVSASLHLESNQEKISMSCVASKDNICAYVCENMEEGVLSLMIKDRSSPEKGRQDELESKFCSESTRARAPVPDLVTPGTHQAACP